MYNITNIINYDMFGDASVKLYCVHVHHRTTAVTLEFVISLLYLRIGTITIQNYRKKKKVEI